MLLEDIQAAYDELLSRIDSLEKAKEEAELKLKTHDYILQRNSKALTDFSWDRVFKQAITVPAAASGGSVKSDAFDISQQSKDASGNLVVPQSFYLLSAWTPDTGIEIVYNGTALTSGTIFMSIERTALTTPTRFESRVVLNNPFHPLSHVVYVEVLKLLGVK